MKNKIKNLSLGLGVAGFSILSSVTNIGVCTGVCGACSLTCAIPIAGVATVGAISLVNKKFKTKRSISSKTH
ncbi:MAG: hypothetical protein PHN47_08365 [Clostridia bacterium]|nr:hypothetical protein [Clostridia bacterium]